MKISKDGFFVFGIDRDRKFDLTFTKTLNGKKSIITKKVLKRQYNIQRIDGLAESKVTPPESVYKRIKKENNAIGEARAINSDLIYFKEKIYYASRRYYKRCLWQSKNFERQTKMASLRDRYCSKRTFCLCSAS